MLIASLKKIFAKKSLSIVAFTQTSEALEISFNKSVGSIKIIHMKNVPLQLSLDELNNLATDVTMDRRILKIPLKNEPVDNEYSIFVFADQSWFELIRQSAHWLKQKFDFGKPDGYSILGRRSINVCGGPLYSADALEFAGRPSLPQIRPAGGSKFPEVKMATGLLEFLWCQPVVQGPTSKSYSDFLQHSLEAKLEIVQNGEFALMCQGMRDLFLHASEGVEGLNARAVEAFNYGRHIPDLISYGHSTAEIWIEELNQYVIFDPWLALMVTDTKGTPIGADQLRLENYTADKNNIEIVALIEKLPRTYRHSDGTVVQNFFRPASTCLRQFSYVDEGYSPGLVEYFRNLVFRDHMILE